MIKKVSVRWLTTQGACPEGKEWFKSECGTDDPSKVIDRPIETRHLDWANWLVTHLMTHDQNIAYAIFAARQVLCHWDAKYPDDTRPLKAIEAAEEYLRTHSTAAGAAAWDAAGAAGDAARAARAARAAMLQKIIEHGISLLKESK